MLVEWASLAFVSNIASVLSLKHIQRTQHKIKNYAQTKYLLVFSHKTYLTD